MQRRTYAQTELPPTGVRAGDRAAGHLLAPRAFRAAVKKVTPSLVTIETFAGVAVVGGGKQSQGLSKPGDGPTTGLIVSPDGHIVTSTYNFITNPHVITVRLADGSRHVARLLGSDRTRKICLLQIDSDGDLPVPAFCPSEKVEIGQWAISLGVGFGEEQPAISVGIVSAKNRISGRAVQTDANISPANYGGPLIDVDGRVIGVCVPLHPESKDVASGTQWYDSGIGFAVPIAGAERIIASLKAGKTLVAPQLGVQVKPPGDDDPSGGIVVEKVLDDSAAAKADVRVGDRIVSVDGTAVRDVSRFQREIGRHVAGDSIKLGLKRGDEKIELEVVLGTAAAADSH